MLSIWMRPHCHHLFQEGYCLLDTFLPMMWKSALAERFIRNSSGSTCVSQEQKSGAVEVWEKYRRVQIWISAEASRWYGSEFDVNSTSPCIQAVNSPGWWKCSDLGRNGILAHLGPLNNNQLWFECDRLSEYCCWPCASLYDHNLQFSNGYLHRDNASCHCVLTAKGMPKSVSVVFPSKMSSESIKYHPKCICKCSWKVNSPLLPERQTAPVFSHYIDLFPNLLHNH